MVSKDRKKIIESKYYRRLIPNSLFNEINNDLTKYVITENQKLSITKHNLISKQIFEEILCSLNKHEQAKGFLKKGITLNKLALELNTNSKYLSKAINLKKKKSFSHYINDLRIEYFINELSENKKITHYTIKAIAEEIGFNTANAFSKAFHKKTGKYPSEFIKDLDN